MKSLEGAFSVSVPLPAIQSVGPPPEKHADRVVAEMLQLIACGHVMVTEDIRQILEHTPDGNPKAQEKLRRKVKEAGGLFLPAVFLKLGKRGRYELRVVSIRGSETCSRGQKPIPFEKSRSVAGPSRYTRAPAAEL